MKILICNEKKDYNISPWRCTTLSSAIYLGFYQKCLHHMLHEVAWLLPTTRNALQAQQAERPVRWPKA